MHPNRLQNFNILVIDDEFLIQNLVRCVLQNLGFTNITLANNGRKAQDLILNQRFDIIITDWRMDDLDGIDVINFVRKSRNSDYYKTPIIMLTGNTEDYYVKTAIDAGINAYLIKPFTAAELVKRIRAVIEFPGDFIISKTFTGPDRRHYIEPPPEGLDRRRKNRRKTA
ncbi:MAG: response regulator [Alphaproteobacteria bacterium]|nr:response regulator [Alphaproteobacteria bacterium]